MLYEKELTGKIIGAAIEVHRALGPGLKAVDKIHALREAQLLTYFRLTSCRIGLLINFNVPVLKHDIKHMVL